MITTIFIDVDNTLLDFNLCAKFSMKSVLNDLGLSYSDDLFKVFLSVNDKLWSDIQNNKLTKEGLYKIRWNMIFEQMNLQVDGVEFEKRFLEYLSTSCYPVLGAHEILEYLSEKYIICIASNAPHEQQMKRLKKADMLKYTDYVFISEKLGYEKPSPKFFNACMKQLTNISPDEIIMIGDSLVADMKGSINVGIKTCWYNHNKEPIDKSTGIIPDFIVNGLQEIKKIL